MTPYSVRSVVSTLLLTLIIAWSAVGERLPLPTVAANPYASAIVIDADSGEPLFMKNPMLKVYPASVIKLMDLYVILDLVQQGKVRLDDKVTASVEAYRMGGSQVFLDVGEQFTVDDLLYALMIQSANDAAVGLAEHVAGSKEAFVGMMNAKAKELGMNNSSFASVHGLPPESHQQPDYSTAKDIAILCRGLLKFPEALQYTSTPERNFRDDQFIMRTHNSLLKSVRGCDGFKTGYFKVAGYSIAATAQRDGKRVIAVVMGSESKQIRDTQATQLIEQGFRDLGR